VLDPRRLALTVITSDSLVPGRGHRGVAFAGIAGGASAIQLRAPDLADDRLLPLAAQLARSCRRAGVLLIVNDRPEVALSASADGVHLGQADDPAGARALLGPDRIFGMSVGTIQEATEAARFGADYLGVTVWRTRTKPEAVAVGLDGVRAIADAVSLPLVGIGGVDVRSAARVIEAGAIGVAVISAVGEAPDPVAATRRLRGVVDDALERGLGAAG
jgi:thiamine-phosphate pyrophosphorylase